MHVTLDRDADGPVTVVAAVAGREAVARISGREAVLSVTVDDPELWWPRGYGEQPRYDLDVTLSDTYGTLDVWSRKVGFRSVRLDTAPTSAFTVVVNDVPVFVRGVNWIPDDVFVTRIDRDRLAAPVRPGRARPTSTTCGSGAAAGTSRRTSTTWPTSSG